VILVDTHIVVWLTLDRKKLSKKAAAVLAQERVQGGGVGVASATLWELALLVSRGRITLPDSLASFLQHVESTFVVFPLTGKIAERGTRFAEAYPRDPMDRIIGATAIIEGISLVTADERIQASKEVSCVW
jgi:PIN domain nuclease of toxin-antitoxin system